MKVGIIGGRGVGKSTLARALANHVEKKGLRTCIANFDAGCKHILYRPAFDIRTYYSLRSVLRSQSRSEPEALAEIYRRAMADSVFNSDFRKTCSQKDLAILDFAGPLDYFLLQGGGRVLAHFCDKVILACDHNAARENNLAGELSLLLTKASGLPCIAFANKCDVLEKKRRKLAQKLLVQQVGVAAKKNEPENVAVAAEEVIAGSALEGMGVRQLFAALEL